eukprot:TRINITY_DN26723_c0_g1_i1.p1 TRINITY_DN26723_c0_g1~~TRINITY_DN26723_c0_g1_i1.p1  ORF type:complete len:265 (+),score=67.24 TRINITY_DN26723_c0_g1_i1:106-900(+)
MADHEKGQHVNQFEDFDSVGHVAFVLGEFVVVNAVFSFATDVCAQKVEGKWLMCKPEVPKKVKAGYVEPEQIDLRRSLRFAGTGVFFCGVVQFVRLAVIDVIFDRNDTTITTALVKTGVNQLVFSPLVRAWSMVTLVLLDDKNGGTWEAAKAKLRESFFEAQGISYMVKPASNFLAFVFFPNHILGQAIVMRTVAFTYNVYFSYTVHKETAESNNIKNLEEEEEEECEELDGFAENAKEPIKDNKPPPEKQDRSGCLCNQCCVM